MREDFRKRVFTPVMLPLTIAGAILLFAFSLSRVLLAVPEAVATAVGVAVAGYVLLVAALVGSRPRISSRSLGVGLALGLVGVLAAGAVAGAAGMRELEHEEEAAAGEPAPEQPADGAGGQEIPADAQVFVAVDIDFSDAPQTLPAGGATIAIDNTGNIIHNVTFEELGDEIIVEAEGGEVDVGTVELEPGEYSYYCSVPGHREAGMEGQLTAE